MNVTKLIAILCCLLTIGVANASDRNGSLFNAKDYGAVGDDETDNTEAFSECVKTIIKAGEGRMLIPDGVYRGKVIILGTQKVDYG
jgi:polygalacturonase